jgi:thiamine biosynthesis lipoprotein ApbE
VLGTSLDLKLAALSLAIARQAEQRILSEIDRLDGVLSSYRADSEFSRWLAAPLNQAVAVSDDLFAVLSGFDHWQQKTGGAINAAAEHLTQLWQRAAQRQSPPTEADCQQAVAAVNQSHWLLDGINQTAMRLTPTALRLNTFTKSYVLNRAAEAALVVPGVDGLVLNSGGDIIVGGNWQESVGVANPRANAENTPPIAHLAVKNRAVATSGNYRQGWRLENEWLSHVMDPRTGRPAQEVISATVVHPDAVTAGALATAFNVLTPAESAQLTAQLPGTAYLLITRDGQSITSPDWPGATQPLSESPLGSVRPTTAHLLSLPVNDKVWNPNQELLITFELARFEGWSHRPFVAVWIEDESGKPVRQLALWYNKARWLHDLREWYSLRVESDVASSVTSATRSAGEYSLVWDGKDDRGQLVKQGKYTVFVEAAREHGTNQLIRQSMDFNGKLKQQPLPGNVEIAAASLDYREKSATR